jgi:hypothetical protein
VLTALLPASIERISSEAIRLKSQISSKESDVFEQSATPLQTWEAAISEPLQGQLNAFGKAVVGEEQTISIRANNRKPRNILICEELKETPRKKLCFAFAFFQSAKVDYQKKMPSILQSEICAQETFSQAVFCQNQAKPHEVKNSNLYA